MNKKGLIGAVKISLILIFLIIIGFLIYTTIGSAESSAKIWTTDIYGNLKTDFAPYTKVYIHGSDFLLKHKVDVYVTRPDNVTEKGFIFSDYSGSFVYEYQLNGIEGLYNVLATDKTNTAQTTFTDSINVNLDQWANKLNQWINGDLNAQKSDYYEGESVPFRLIIKGLPGGSHYIHINYDFSKGGIYAYDFLTRFDFSENPDISADTSVPVPAGPINNYTIPSDTFDDVALHELPAAERYISIIGGSITNIEAITHQDKGGGSSDADMLVHFNTGTCTVDCTLFLLWGGHLASELDWGIGMGASSISGAPFHMRTQSLDDSGKKNQDRSIMPGAILPPPKGKICGYKWNDTNSNGVKDFGENYLSGWNITLTGPINSSQLTNSSGYYCFFNLINGTYVVSEILKNGWVQTYPPSSNYTLDIICNGGSCTNFTDKKFGNKEAKCFEDLDCDDGNVCTLDKCIDYSCVYTPEPLSTSCEADENLCTIDHCDGAGTCVTYDNVFVPEPEQCKSFYCDPTDGQVKEDYTDYPLSTTCELDSNKCTIDHCDGYGSCVWKEDVVVPPAEDCKSFYCDPSDGLIKEDYSNYPLSTPCELDNDKCTIDHCNGSGSCVWKEDVTVPQPEDCKSFYCDPLDGTVKENYTDYPLSTFCELDQDLCTHDHCDGFGSCVWNYDEPVPDPEECKSFYCDPLDGNVKENYTDYPLSTVCEADYDKCTKDHCDGYGSCVNDYNVTVPEPEQCKSFYCDPADGSIKDNYTDYPESTYCELDEDLCTKDHCNGQGFCINYDNVTIPAAEQCKSFYCDPTDGLIKDNYTAYPYCTSCEADQDPCTIDHCDGEGFCVTYDIIPGPSMPNKTVGEPKTPCEQGEWCDYKITILTPITISCENGANVSWRYALDGEWKEWHNDTSPVTIYFPEESNHTLEAYCINACGESEVDSEKFKVEGTAFEIPLYKKWNLISVPFPLLNNSIDEVFKNIKNNISSVWTYDNESWYVWTPDDGPDTLFTILSGWGYWVLANNNGNKLVIGGSLFSPATTPPSKPLVEGWNLIGYYGTDWQEYNITPDDCGYNYDYGSYLYCSLGSLIDTQIGFPRWSSLWSYINCGNDSAYWISLNVCDYVYAGKGYWVEMDVEDLYAPASTCIWNENFICP